MPLIEAKYGIRIVVDFILLLTVGIPILLFFLLGKPFERGFYCNDDSIRYPYRDSTVSTIALYLVGTLLPFGAMLLLEWVRCRRDEVGRPALVCGRAVPAYLWSLYTTVGVFLFGCACSQLLTDVAKYTIGRLRPHFIAICNPDWDQIDCSVPGTYIEPVCRPADEFRLKEARLSFPSGHASFSAFTMVYLVLYLQARLRIRVRLVRPFLQFVCLLIAFYTALSRVSDYKHHWSDVMLGSTLGSIVAIAVWSCVSDARVYFDSRGGQAAANSSWLPLAEVAPNSGSVGNLPSHTAPALTHQEQRHQRIHVDHIRLENMNARYDVPSQYSSNLPYLQTLQSRQPLPRQERRLPRQQPQAQQEAQQVQMPPREPSAAQNHSQLDQRDTVYDNHNFVEEHQVNRSPKMSSVQSSSSVIANISGGTTCTSIVCEGLGSSSPPVSSGGVSGKNTGTRHTEPVYI